MNSCYHRLITVVIAACSLTIASAQIERNAAFRSQYQLEEVVVLSRHNIRSPMSGPESALGRITPHQWFAWTSAPSELSLRGGVLETEMGQFFRKWLVSEGLMQENELPAEGAFRFYANSMQRTIATAQYFSSGMLPVANVSIEHHYDVGTMDPTFTPKWTSDNDELQSEAIQQITDIFGDTTLEGIGERMRENYDLLQEVLDMDRSAACTQGDTCSFRTDNTEIVLQMDKEPGMKGDMKLACQAADALVLQYYEEPDEQKAAFGHQLSRSDWKKISAAKDYYGDVLFTAPLVAINVAHPLLQELLTELKTDGRTFAFLCGHDSNIGSVLAALGVNDYDLPDAIEAKTPIGCKFVIEKWLGSDGKEYAALNMVYQTVDQLRQMPLLSLDNPPAVYPLALEGLTANADGLYLLSDLEQRFKERIEAYDQAPTVIRTAATEGNSRQAVIYNLQGHRLDNASQKSGIYIKDRQKVIMK